MTYPSLKPDWFIKIAILVVTWSVNLFIVLGPIGLVFKKSNTGCHVIDAIVIYKNAIPVRTSHVWTIKTPFVQFDY